MGLISMVEIIELIRKNFLKILAFSLAVAILGGFAANYMQTYTCTLGFKYNYEGAADELAPDGVSKLDPYEIQNPVVIQAALEDMGVSANDSTVKGIRQNITVNKVVTDLDKEVSESAALLGEKYDVTATEYEMSFKYKAYLGEEFGIRMFSNIVNAYDEFLLNKYYNKRTIEDFAKVVKDSDAEYIVIAESMSENLDNIIAYLEEQALNYPDFRSRVTGYTFSELALIYRNLRDIQYAKYYGNIRIGNLARDREMVIKSYQTKVQGLWEQWNIDQPIAENYKNEIITFYDSYKAAGLYTQAEEVQRNPDSSNNRDQDVLSNKALEEYTNTYDDIILNYTTNAGNATDAVHTINYYNMIIDAYGQDTVPEDVKNDLIGKNEIILNDIVRLSAEYSDIANKTITELYNQKVNNALQYLILPEANADIPVQLIVIFLAVLSFGFGLIFVIVAEFLKKNDLIGEKSDDDVQENNGTVDMSDMDELHRLLYQQYMAGFSEFFLVYQDMLACKDDLPLHCEAFIRWNSSELGLVPSGKIIECVADLNIFNQFNDWIIKNVCEDLALRRERDETMPIVHINCPHSELDDFALNDIILNYTAKNRIPVKNVCLELEGKDVSSSLEDIMLLSEMGVSICIDRFEDSNEEQEIISVIKPNYIKMNMDILSSDIYTTQHKNILKIEKNVYIHISDIILRCNKNGIRTCICGIENEMQDKLVRNLGFDYTQGYYYKKPEALESR
ncbi:MAG: EAL domain-containing protein [Oscillospiraceae bacterium]|nr:EAL domain-containing protein [Oscillospiraceae bacterium]